VTAGLRAAAVDVLSRRVEKAEGTRATGWPDKMSCDGSGRGIRAAVAVEAVSAIINGVDNSGVRSPTKGD